MPTVRSRVRQPRTRSSGTPEWARSEGVELNGDDGLLTALVRQVLQTGLEVEMTDHLGYEAHAAEGRVGQQPLPQDGDHRGWQVRVAGPSAPQLELCAGDGAQGLTGPTQRMGQRVRMLVTG